MLDFPKNHDWIYSAFEPSRVADACTIVGTEPSCQKRLLRDPDLRPKAAACINRAYAGRPRLAIRPLKRSRAKCPLLMQWTAPTAGI